MPLGASRLSLLAYQAAVAAGGRTPKTLTANGNVEVSTVQSKFGGASARFFTTDATDGSTDTIVTNTSDDFIFSGDFTWETWVYIIDNSSNDTMTFLGNRGGFNANNLYIAARTVDNKWQWGNSTMGANITTQTFSYNTWYHIALVRDGMGTNNFTFYVNGVALQSDTDTNTLGGGGANFISIGGIDSATDSFGLNGYIDEVRISPTARYTANFTPSTTAFTNDDDTVLLIHADGANGSTTFTDDTAVAASGRTAITLTAQQQVQVSTAQSKFGGASAYFDGGTDDYILVDHTQFSHAYSDNFTYECWVRLDSLPSLFTMLATGSTRGDYLSIYNKSGTWTLHGAFSNGSSIYYPIYNIGSTPSINTWYHVAVVKDGASLKLFWDGTELTVNNGSSGTMSADKGWNGISRIGDWAGGSNYATTGYIDEVRWSSTARYSSSFTPSTSAFANDADTLLLVHMDGVNGSTTFTDDTVTPARTAVALTANGNAQVDTSQSKFGGASAYFYHTSSGNYISANTGDVPAFGTGDFTLEYWLRLDVLGSTYGYMYWDQRPGSNGNYPLLFTDANGATNLRYFINGADRIVAPNGTLSVDTWHHIAVVRNSGTTKMYVDGVQKGSSYTDSTDYQAGRLYLGSNMNGINTVNGWMDEIRASSIARYTGNFTPPTAAFANDTDTLLLIHADGADGSTTFVDDNS